MSAVSHGSTAVRPGEANCRVSVGAVAEGSKVEEDEIVVADEEPMEARKP